MKTGWKLALAAVGFLGIAGQGAAAQEVRLFMTSMSPPGSPNSVFYNAWAKRVNEQSHGTLNIEVRDSVSLASFPNVVDRVMDDVVQIGWSIHGMYGGRFPLTEVADLPFLADTNQHGSVALWRLYASGLLDSEYKDLHPVFFGLVGLTGLHFAKEPKTIDDLKGLKIRVVGKVQSDMITRLGGAPISLPSDDMYSGLQRGTIDAAATSWTAFGPYKLLEVTSFHVEGPLGTSTSMFFMAKKKYEALPPAGRKAIDDNSGEAATLAFANSIDSQGIANRQQAVESGKHKIVQLDPSQIASWSKAVEPVVDQWTKDWPGGDKVLAAYRKILADVQAGR
jgi:TRAP-type C4-dicarboxylate transport system substrate-binding protein